MIYVFFKDKLHIVVVVAELFRMARVVICPCRVEPLDWAWALASRMW